MSGGSSIKSLSCHFRAIVLQVFDLWEHLIRTRKITQQKLSSNTHEVSRESLYPDVHITRKHKHLKLHKTRENTLQSMKLLHHTI